MYMVRTVATIITATIMITAMPTTSTTMIMPTRMGTMTIIERAAADIPADIGALRDDGVLMLAVWLSPAFPVGGFTYSHGLEWAIEDGSVTTATALEAWLRDILTHGAGRNDAILFAHAWRAARTDDSIGLADCIELADAFQPSRERRLEASAQGAAFAKAIGDTWSNPAYAAMTSALKAKFGTIPWTYATAVAVATASHDLALRPALSAYLQAFAANVISAGVRAIPLGQTEGLKILSRMTPLLFTIADTAISATLDDLGGAAVRADIASMQHETQYTRLFRS